MPDISKITTPDGTSWDVKDLKARGVELTQAEYDALEQAGGVLSDVDYHITDAQAGTPLATEIAMSTSDNTSVASAISGINTKLTDYIKVKYFSVTIADSTRNMDLTARAQAVIDSGYKFLTYISVVPTNFTTDSYLWLSKPYIIEGRPWWNTNPIPGSNASSTIHQLTYTFLEIRN